MSTASDHQREKLDGDENAEVFTPSPIGARPAPRDSAAGRSVPVIDVGGELMVGFDRARLEKLL